MNSKLEKLKQAERDLKKKIREEITREKKKKTEERAGRETRVLSIIGCTVLADNELLDKVCLKTTQEEKAIIQQFRIDYPPKKKKTVKSQ